MFQKNEIKLFERKTGKLKEVIKIDLKQMECFLIKKYQNRKCGFGCLDQVWFKGKAYICLNLFGNRFFKKSTDLKLGIKGAVKLLP